MSKADSILKSLHSSPACKIFCHIYFNFANLLHVLGHLGQASLIVHLEPMHHLHQEVQSLASCPTSKPSSKWLWRFGSQKRYKSTGRSMARALSLTILILIAEAGQHLGSGGILVGGAGLLGRSTLKIFFYKTPNQLNINK